MSVSEGNNELLAFLDASPTPFHAVAELRKLLLEAGFQELTEKDSWQSLPGAKQFLTRGTTSLAAWIQGTEPPMESGYRLIGAHTDSPNLRVKPNADVNQHGYRQIGVEVYGGVLLSSWADRDLSIAGKVYVQGASGRIEEHLLRYDHPLFRIPLLAIHLNREVNEKGLVLNSQNHLPPVYGLKDDSLPEESLNSLLAEILGIKSEKILSYDLSLYDTQQASRIGINHEFIASGRLDNLFCCFCAIEAILSDLNNHQAHTRLMVCFDHEEIGSMTSQGARSSFLVGLLRRLNRHCGYEAYLCSCAKSMLLSADMAHAIHPNYPEKHEPLHFPKMNGGPVIKINAQGRYATSGFSEGLFELICREKNIPVQKFVNRTDLSCGSTIGPFLAGDLGVPTLDVGAAMLSMHSIRELAGSQDASWLIDAFSGFLTRSSLN